MWYTITFPRKWLESSPIALQGHHSIALDQITFPGALNPNEFNLNLNPFDDPKTRCLPLDSGAFRLAVVAAPFLALAAGVCRCVGFLVGLAAMALRIRKDGRILCAAMHPAEDGDTYIDDGLHYQMSVERKVIVTEYMDQHKSNGQWWWRGNIPEGITIDNFYLTD